MLQEQSIGKSKINGKRKKTSQKEEHKSQFQVSLISDETAFDALAEEWNDLVVKSDSSICQTYEWQRIWWKYFGEKSDAHRLHILILRNQENLVGIAPLFIDEFMFMGKPLYRCLRLIGTKVMQDEKGTFLGEENFSEFMDLIILPGFEYTFYRVLMEHIKSLRELDAVIMEEVPDYSDMFTDMVPLLKKNQNNWEINITQSSVFTYIKLPDSWESFLEGVNQKARYKIRKYLKRIKEDSPQKVFEYRKLTKGDEIKTAFEWLVKIHQKRWNQRGRPGLFTEKRMYDLFRDLNLVFTQKGATSVQAILVPKEERYVALDLMFEFRDTMYGIHRGFDADSSYREYSPGNIILYKSIKDAINNGYKRFNFLRGKEKYKLQIANEIVQNKNIIIQLNQEAHLFKIKMYRILQWFLLKKFSVKIEWNILMIFCHQYSLLTGLDKFRMDVYRRFKKKMESSGS